MADTKLPEADLVAHETALAEKLAKLIVLIANYFFKDKVQSFLEAIIRGLSAADTTAEPTFINIISEAADINVEIATLDNNEIYLQVAKTTKQITTDVSDGKFSFLDWIHSITSITELGKAIHKAKAKN